MRKIVAINASPRINKNTAALVKEAAKGAEKNGAEIKYYDIYRLSKFTGCVSCFGCKTPEHLGECVCKDGLSEILEEIKTADGIIIGTPNYLGDVSAGFRSLYERLVFKSISYKTEPRSYNKRKIPVLFIMTSNCSEDFYDKIGYDKMLERYKNTLNGAVGPTKIMVCGDTLQVDDYEKYNWTVFDVNAKRTRHRDVFPKEAEKAFSLGEEMINNPWE